MKTALAELKPIPAAGLRALRANDLIIRLVAGFGVGITTRVGILVMEVIIGRELSPDGFGTFSFTLGLVTLGAAFGSLGWLDAITRFVAQFVVERRWGALRGVLVRSQQIVLGSTTIIGVGIGISAWVVRDDQVLSSCLLLAALCLPLFTMKQLRCRQIQGLNRPKLGMFLNEGAIPLLVIPVLLLVTLRSPATAVGIYLLMTFVVLNVVNWFFRHYVPDETAGAEPEFHARMDTCGTFADGWPIVRNSPTRRSIDHCAVFGLDRYGVVCFRVSHFPGAAVHSDGDRSNCAATDCQCVVRE